jgi:phosphatidate cytidylyltransferase
MKSMSDPNPSPVQRSWLHSSIAMRVIASVAFIPCFIIITQKGGYHFLALTAVIIVIGMQEFYAMMEAKGVRPYKAIGIICGMALSWYMFFRNGVYANLFLTIALLLIMALELSRKDNRMAVYHIATTILGVVYVAFLSMHMVLLRELPTQLDLPYAYGSGFVFLAFIVTWASDTGAYFVGTLIGRTPLLPRVSAKKTWEGAIGGFFFATIGAVIAHFTFAEYLGLWQAAILGLCASIMGLLGDLVESLMKRDVDLKDTSEVIPGHGGVLDRFDSLLFTVPLIYYFLKFVIFE